MWCGMRKEGVLDLLSEALILQTVLSTSDSPVLGRDVILWDSEPWSCILVNTNTFSRNMGST